MIGHEKAPCPELYYEDGRYWCRVVTVERLAKAPPLVATVLGIGTYCTMTDDLSYWYPEI